MVRQHPSTHSRTSLLEHVSAYLGPQRHLDSVGKLLDTSKDGTTAVHSKSHVLRCEVPHTSVLAPCLRSRIYHVSLCFGGFGPVASSIVSNMQLEFLLSKVCRKSVPLSRGYAFQPSHCIRCFNHRMVPCSLRFQSVTRIVPRRSSPVSSGSCTSVLRVHHGFHVRRVRSVRHFSSGFFLKGVLVSFHASSSPFSTPSLQERGCCTMHGVWMRCRAASSSCGFPNPRCGIGSVWTCRPERSSNRTRKGSGSEPKCDGWERLEASNEMDRMVQGATGAEERGEGRTTSTRTTTNRQNTGRTSHAEK